MMPIRLRFKPHAWIVGARCCLPYRFMQLMRFGKCGALNVGQNTRMRRNFHCLNNPIQRRQMDNLFQQGDFRLHSGDPSPFKVDCDALTPEDWATLAAMVAQHTSFSEVVGVPQGGLPFAEALQQYADHDTDDPHLLIVDDVLTTGTSMQEVRDAFDPSGHGSISGVVVFARGECPAWIHPIFKMDEAFLPLAKEQPVA